MRILIITPAPPGSLKGNRITALRWARLLRQLGHTVKIDQQLPDQTCDVMVALHARRSARAVRWFHQRYPERPLILALTGTDLYRDIHRHAAAQRSLELASRLVLLQPHGIRQLPNRLRKKACVIYQSVVVPGQLPRPRSSTFDVCVMGHLRPVKDPFRAALAAKLLPPSSKLRIQHIGAALTSSMQQQAVAEMDINPRYRWLGELPRSKAIRRLAKCRLLVLTSIMEGGANVISEAISVRVPILSSKISGSIGLLGQDYPGYFRVGDTKALARLLRRAEEDQAFYQSLKSHGDQLKSLFEPVRERESWRQLLSELLQPSRAKG